MDYQQSLKNFNHLKNFIRARTFCQIFFFFKSETECEYIIETFDLDRKEEQLDQIETERIKGLPFASIINDRNGDEQLFYHDENMDIEYDLFREEFIIFYCYDPVDLKLLQQQFSMLFKLLENK